MKRYRFGLQKVLDYNAHIQRSEAEVMERLQAEHRAMQARNDALAQSFRSESLRFQRDCAAGQTAGQAAATGRYLRDLTQEIDRGRAELAQQAQRVEAQRQRLLAVTQDKEIIEKLRERSRAEYLVAERKADEQFIEEFLANRTAQSKS